MKHIREDFEIMAPVGSFESLMAAIQAGADSVYFGIEKLNMRSRSSVNFTSEDLQKITEICKNNRVKTYLTVNIAIYQDEIAQMHTVIDSALQHGIDAVIASDMAVINYANCVGMPVHISTQLNVSNSEAVEFYSKYADVMVLARELSLDQVSEISDTIQHRNICGPGTRPVRIEMFCHGALCMSISGKCYLSLHEYNYSANRGACLQTCRRAYTVKDKETDREFEVDNEYIMSPKDLCTIHFTNKMMDAGVRVFKIEGRARPAEYVKTVVSCYNEAIESVIDNTFDTSKIEDWMNRLKTVFNRGFWDGYYLGQKLGEWSHVYGSQATQKKMFVGKVTNYFSKIGVAEILCEASELDQGTTVILTGPTTGVVETTANDIRVDHKSVKKAVKGEYFSIQTNEIVRRSDKLYKLIEVKSDKNKFN